MSRKNDTATYLKGLLGIKDTKKTASLLDPEKLSLYYQDFNPFMPTPFTSLGLSRVEPKPAVSNRLDVAGETPPRFTFAPQHTPPVEEGKAQIEDKKPQTNQAQINPELYRELVKSALKTGDVLILEKYIKEGYPLDDIYIHLLVHSYSGIPHVLITDFNLHKKTHLSLLKWLMKNSNGYNGSVFKTNILKSAAESAELPVFSWLIANYFPNSDRPEIFTAIEANNTPVIDYLLQKYPNLYKDKDIQGYTPLLRGIASHANLEFLKSWVRKYPNAIKDTTDLGHTLLLVAAMYGKLDIVQWLLEQDPNRINEQDKEGDNALIWAASNGKLNVIQWLVQQFPHMLNPVNGFKALYNAIKYGDHPSRSNNQNFSVVKWILENYPHLFNEQLTKIPTQDVEIRKFLKEFVENQSKTAIGGGANPLDVKNIPVPTVAALDNQSRRNSIDSKTLKRLESNDLTLEKKNSPIASVTSLNKSVLKNLVVSPIPQSEIKDSLVAASVSALSPTNPVNTNVVLIDAQKLEQLLKLMDQKQAQLTPTPAPESKESLEVLQKKLSSLEGAMNHLDGQALTALQGKAQEVRDLIAQASEQRLAEAERNYIEADDVLCDAYYVIRSQLLHMWLACQVIHSEMVDNDKKTKLDYLAENIDKVAGRFPGLSLLTGFIKAAASGWSYHEKKAAMQNMAAFCLGLVEGDNVIDTLSRQLTITLETTLKAKIHNKKTSKFKKALEIFKKAKNWALVNDIDNPTKEFAAEQSAKILEAVMKGEVATPCRKKDIPLLFALVMGQNAVYQSPLVVASTNLQTKVNGASVATSVQQSYISKQTLFSPAAPVSPPDELAELKRWKAEQEKRAKEQEDKMQAMQEELARVKNQTQQPIAQKSDLDSLQSEFNRLKAESERNGSVAQKQDVEHLQKELKKLKEGFEQAGISSGGNQAQLQMSGNAFGSGTTNEQRRIAELEQQVRLLTARVLTSQEQDNLLSAEEEDSARLKLLA